MRSQQAITLSISLHNHIPCFEPYAAQVPNFCSLHQFLRVCSAQLTFQSAFALLPASWSSLDVQGTVGDATMLIKTDTGESHKQVLIISYPVVQ